MQRRSRLWVILHHPFESLVTSFIVYIIIKFVGLMFFENFMTSISRSETASNVLMALCLWIGLGILKREYRDRLECYGYDRNGRDLSPKQKKKKPSPMPWIFSATNSSSQQQSTQSRSNAFMSSSSSSRWAQQEAEQRARRQAADRAARERWDAIDRQKKAEWDARDAYLRGKDKAAQSYQNKADYWRNQSRR